METPPAPVHPASLPAEKQEKATLWLLQPADVGNDAFQPLIQTLTETGIPHQTVSLASLGGQVSAACMACSGKYLLLPLSYALTDEELKVLEAYLLQGGRLVLLPPEETNNTNVLKLFEQVHIPLDTVNFVSQSLELKWQARAAGLSAPLKEQKAAIAVGSQLLSLKPAAQSKVLALWGEDFPAIVQSDKAVLFNWPWGQELSPQTNAMILAELAGLSYSHPAVIETRNPDIEMSRLLFPKSAGYSALDGDGPGAGAIYRLPGQFTRDRQYLLDSRTMIDDGLEAALLMDIALPVKTIQQHLVNADLEATRFEHAYQAGRLEDAQRAYQAARKHVNEALLLTSPSPRVEGRAIWLDRGTIVDSGSPQGLKKVFERLKKAGINVIYFETINAGFPVYPSKLMKQNPMTEGWDPLQAAITEGHKLGMEVHAWVWCFAVGNKRHNPIIGKPLDYPGPVLEDAGLMSEALKGPAGNLLPGGRQYEFWLSPASPKGRQFLLDLYAEIVSNYDVDGIQLDYIRYPFQKPGNTMGHEPVGRQRFYQSTGMSIDGGEQAYRTWVAWKTYQVTSFVKEISDRLRPLRENLKISAAVFPMPRASRIVAIQQDWETWIENGWIDTLSPMSYTTSAKMLQKTFQGVEDASKSRALIYPGIAIHKLGASDLLRQLEALRLKGALGSTIFAMAHLDDAKVLALNDGPYKEKSTVTPHKDPVQATLVLSGDYQKKLQTLIQNQDVAAPQAQTLLENLRIFQTDLGALKDDANKPARLSALRQTLNLMNRDAGQWLAAEKSLHPYRVEYFNELMLRLNQLLTYVTATTLRDAKSPPAAETAKNSAAR